MKIKRKHYIFELMAVLLLAACSEDGSFAELSGDNATQRLTFDVRETDWKGETVSVTTRSGETLDGLRATSGSLPDGYGYGFGFYCKGLNYSNTNVTWDGGTSSWKIGEDNHNTYWERSRTGILNVYAYAPYLELPTLTEVDNAEEGKDTLLTFTAQKYNVNPLLGHNDKLSGGNDDLLWAKAEYDLHNSDPAVLTFQHMLAKLTFGTITNNTGGTLRLNGFTVKGDLNTEAKLNLKTGKWEGHVRSSGATISSPPPFIKVVSNESERTYPIPAGYIAYSVIPPLLNKQTVIPNMPNRSLLLIPNANGEIEVTIEVNSDIANEKFSFPVTLKQGEDKTINITIGESFEVVIDGQ